MMDIVGTAWPIIVLFKAMTKGINQGKNIFQAKHHGFSYFFNAIFFLVWGGGLSFPLVRAKSYSTYRSLKVSFISRMHLNSILNLQCGN